MHQLLDASGGTDKPQQDVDALIKNMVDEKVLLRSLSPSSHSSLVAVKDRDTDRQLTGQSTARHSARDHRRFRREGKGASGRGSEIGGWTTTIGHSHVPSAARETERTSEHSAGKHRTRTREERTGEKHCGGSEKTPSDCSLTVSSCCF